LGNVSGGSHQGSVDDGRLNLAVDVDFQKLAEVQGLTFHVAMFQTRERFHG
jgi:porin